jgi:hypothetical protein
MVPAHRVPLPESAQTSWLERCSSVATAQRTLCVHCHIIAEALPCRQLLQAAAASADAVTFEDVIDAAKLEELVQQPGVAARLLPLLPEEVQTEVCHPPAVLAVDLRHGRHAIAHDVYWHVVMFTSAGEHA